MEITEKAWSKNNDERIPIANLKKGQSFGDHSILNNKKRSATCVCIGNCTFLTVERQDFVRVFGPYFFEQKRLAMKFLMSKVGIFKEVPRDKFFNLILYTIKVDYPQGQEWEICKEKYIYFIVRGSSPICPLKNSESLPFTRQFT